MKTIIVIVLLSFSSYIFNAQCITFTYDAAGNRTQRNICPAPLPAQPETQVLSLQEKQLALESEEVHIRPNPSGGLFYLLTAGMLPETPLQVLDLQGRLISTRALGTGELDLSDLPDGTYVLRLQLADKVISRKVVKVYK